MPPPRASLHPSSRLLLMAGLVILAVQLFMRITASATSWRGGGFGMYASPHPVSYRVVVAELHHTAGVERIRLIPVDPTVAAAVRGWDNVRARDFEELRRRTSRARVLPTTGQAAKLAEEVVPFVQAGLFGPEASTGVDSIVVSFHEIRPRLAQRAFTTGRLSRGVHRPR